MNWIKLSDKKPDKNGTFWCYPTPHEEKYCALYWDGDCFSSGNYTPEGITHYREMRLEKPKPPED